MVRWSCVVVLLVEVLAATVEGAAETTVERPEVSRMAAGSSSGGNAGDSPSVSTSHLRHRRSLEFDGWFPMDVSNPMADEPTLGYQPPPLSRVRFSNEPVSEKPLYPVIPENPTVFVVRAESHQPEYHSVYGTENVEYFHINPQSNTVQAFRTPSQNPGAIQFVPAPQLPDSETVPTSSSNENIDTLLEKPESNSESPIIPVKEDGFADKSDTGIVDQTDRSSNIDTRRVANNNCEGDLEGSFSEHRPSVVHQSYSGLPFRRNQPINRRTNGQTLRHRPDLPARRRDNFNNYIRVEVATPSRPALHELLGNNPRESQIEVSPYLGSATDSAGASFREIPPPDYRYSSRRPTTRQSPGDGRLHPGTEARRTPAQSSHRPWFLIDTRSPNKRREPSIASYIFPETLAGDEKVHYKPYGPVSYVTKVDKTALDQLNNPHLDDHMNSYKPTLTANSLSELLQIFRFTQVTEESDSATDEPVTVREFRYTRPTEDPPTTGDGLDILPTNFRYTPSPDKFSDPTTEAGITEKPPGNYLDAVADTNSLDGYLFSDSEASPEYAHPQVRPNVVTVNKKDESTPKSVTKSTLATKLSTNINSKNVRGGLVTPGRLEGLEIIFPGQSQSRKDVTPSPFYVIHQGHSKVKVFGINSAEEKPWSDDTFDDLFLFSSSEYPSANSKSLFTTASPSTSFIPSRSTISSTTTTTTSTTTTTTTNTTPSPTTTITTTSTTDSPATTAPSTVEPDTIPPTTDVTTEFSLTSVNIQSQNITSAQPSLQEEYDYYYDGKLEYPDLAFGEDYHQTGGQNVPLLRVPSPFPSEQDFPHLGLSLPPTRHHPADGPHNRLPHTGSRLHGPEALALSPAVALSRAELSVARPVFFTKRRPDATEEDAQLSQPFEYLSQLRNIEAEKQSVLKEPTGTTKAPQPQLKRVTESQVA